MGMPMPPSLHQQPAVRGTWGWRRLLDRCLLSGALRGEALAVWVLLERLGAPCCCVLSQGNQLTSDGFLW